MNNIGDLYEAGLFVEDYTTFLATAPHQHGHTGTWPAPAKFDRITVDNVSFTYPAASGPALREVSLEIQAGQVIALVGENGSGKTTLAKLLSRLYLPAAGTIRWDGTDTADLDPDELHRRIAVIFQDFARYDLTARENIGFGAVEHVDDQAAVQAAARHAGADSYLSELPKGYETILSPEYDGGRDLSVGQWQRVALAAICTGCSPRRTRPKRSARSGWPVTSPPGTPRCTTSTWPNSARPRGSGSASR